MHKRAFPLGSAGHECRVHGPILDLALLAAALNPQLPYRPGHGTCYMFFRSRGGDMETGRFVCRLNMDQIRHRENI